MSKKECNSNARKQFVRLKNEAGTEDVYYSLAYDGIPAVFKAVARNELNENEDNVRTGISKLKEFLKKKDIVDVEDQILLTVLRASKFNIKNSEKKLMKYLQVQNTVIEWLQTADMERLESVLNNRIVGILPYRDKHGRIVYFSNPRDADLDLHDINDIAICTFCLILYGLTFPLTTIAGLIYVAECESPSLSILYIAIKELRRHLSTILSLPLRVSRVDFINENFVIRWGYNILRPLLPSKIKERVNFHGNEIVNLQKFCHPDILPDQFGGNMRSTFPALIKEDFLNFLKRLKSRNQFL